MHKFTDAIPAQFQQRVAHHGFETPEEAFYDCPEHGPIIPYHVKLTGRWLKGRCACTDAQLRRQEQAEIRIAWMHDQLKHNYDWLGSSMPSDMPLRDKTFENFNEGFQDDAFDEVMKWLNTMHGSLILHSVGFGTGKTHLLAAIVNCLRINGMPSRFAPAPKLFRAIQQHIDRHEEYTPLIHKACTTALLVLDDVDKAKPSEWKHEIFFEIIDERVKRGLPIALSTNRISDLAFYVGGAACSRLSISQIDVDMSGVDYRVRL